jgi:hypothetical protein
VADVGARVAAGLGEGNEILDQLFEENIVFPERVVRVDHQGVASHLVFTRYVIFWDLLANRQCNKRSASSAMSAAALGRAISAAALRISSIRGVSLSNLAIFQAAAGRLLQRMAARCSSR